MPGLSKLLILIAIAWIGWRIYRRWQAMQQTHRRANPPSPQNTEEMARCNHCDVYFPAAHGIRAQGKIFCSENHRKQYLSTQHSD